MDKYRIVMTGHGRGEVFRNGEKLERVTRVEFSAGVQEMNTVTLTFHADEVEVDAEAVAQRDVTDIGDEARKYESA